MHAPHCRKCNMEVLRQELNRPVAWETATDPGDSHIVIPSGPRDVLIVRITCMLVSSRPHQLWLLPEHSNSPTTLSPGKYLNWEPNVTRVFTSAVERTACAGTTSTESTSTLASRDFASMSSYYSYLESMDGFASTSSQQSYTPSDSTLSVETIKGSTATMDISAGKPSTPTFDLARRYLSSSD